MPSEQDIKDCVITVPAFYNQAERRAVKTAAEMVGLNVLQLLSDNAAGVCFTLSTSYRYPFLSTYTQINDISSQHLFYSENCGLL